VKSLPHWTTSTFRPNLVAIIRPRADGAVIGRLKTRLHEPPFPSHRYPSAHPAAAMRRRHNVFAACPLAFDPLLVAFG
jgi:hypothetical protein